MNSKQRAENLNWIYSLIQKELNAHFERQFSEGLSREIILALEMYNQQVYSIVEHGYETELDRIEAILNPIICNKQLAIVFSSGLREAARKHLMLSSASDEPLPAIKRSINTYLAIQFSLKK